MRPYLRLARVQNLPTAVADPVAGALLLASRGGAVPWGRLLALAGVSAALYAAGIVLNDVADAERDRGIHPGRPLASGQIPVGKAAVLGGGLLFAGLFGAMSVGFGAIFVATLIALFVVLYDFVLKKARWAGCVAMGVLRGLNFALGMSAIFDEASPWREVLRDPLLVGPAILAAYVIVLTVLSTFEEGKGARIGVPGALFAASLVPMAAILLAPRPASAAVPAAALAVLILARAAAAVKKFEPARTGLLVRDGVRAIPVIDGILVMGHGQVVGGLAVMALVVPAVLLGRWFKGS